MILGCDVKSLEGVDGTGPNLTRLVTKTRDKLQSKQSHTSSHQTRVVSQCRRVFDTNCKTRTAFPSRFVARWRRDIGRSPLPSTAVKNEHFYSPPRYSGITPRRAPRPYRLFRAEKKFTNYFVINSWLNNNDYDRSVLKFYAVLTGKQLSALRRSVRPPSSGINIETDSA